VQRQQIFFPLGGKLVVTVKKNGGREEDARVKSHRARMKLVHSVHRCDRARAQP